MPLQHAKDLVHQTSTTTGTGNFTLVAVLGKRNFSVFGTGSTNTFDYYISNRDAAEWERGTGYIDTSTGALVRTAVESSNSNALVNFSAGTKDVTNDVPAADQDLIYTRAPLDNPAFTGTVREGNTAVDTWLSGYIPHYIGRDNVIVASSAAGGAGTTFSLFNNAYLDASVIWRRIRTGYSSVIQFLDGNIYFYVAASGAAGSAITWILAFQIDSAGNLIGATPGSTSNDTKLVTSAFAALYSLRNDLAQSFTEAQVRQMQSNINLTPPGAGYFQMDSGTQCSFRPKNGNKLKLNGKIYTIPTSSLTVVNNSQGTDNTKMCYAKDDGAGNLALELSTVGHGTSNTAPNEGTEIWGNDQTRTLVGMVRIGPSGTFIQALSYFNRQARVSNTFVGNVTTNVTATTLLSSLIGFLNWGDEDVSAVWEGQAGNDSSFGQAMVGIDGANIHAAGQYLYFLTTTNASLTPGCIGGIANPAEGWHTYGGYMGATSGAGNTYIYNSTLILKTRG